MAYSYHWGIEIISSGPGLLSLAYSQISPRVYFEQINLFSCPWKVLQVMRRFYFYITILLKLRENEETAWIMFAGSVFGFSKYS